MTSRRRAASPGRHARADAPRCALARASLYTLGGSGFRVPGFRGPGPEFPRSLSSRCRGSGVRCRDRKTIEFSTHASGAVCGSGHRVRGVDVAAGAPRCLAHRDRRDGRHGGRGGAGDESRRGRGRRARHCRGGYGRGDWGAVFGSGHHRRARPRGAARPDQHAYARAHGALPRAGRRPRAHGMAAEVHLSGGGEDGQP